MIDLSSNNIIVFDVETQRTFDEVGGFENKEKLGISYVGLYSYSQDKLFGFFEDDLPTLEKILIAEKPILMGFNSINFDVPVMQPYFPNIDLSALPHLDLLKEVEKALGHRLKLDSIAQATLHSKKSGDGLDAIRWYREGNLDSLAKYCLKDVEITRDIYEFGKRHGKLYYPSGGDKKEIFVEWAEGRTIREQLNEAFKKHQEVIIEYFEPHENGAELSTLTIEILDFDIAEHRFEAYCKERDEKTHFDVRNVWKIQDTGETFAHQGSLF